MITFVAVLFDGRSSGLPAFSAGRYGPEWADRLYRGIKRNLSQPFRFVCLVDREYEFAEPIEQVMLDDASEGWMAINEIFRPDLGIERGIFMGLDTVITGSLDDIAAFDGEVGVPSDPVRTHELCNAVVSFDAASADFIWTEWNRDREHWRRSCTLMEHPSEMVFLRKLWPRPAFQCLGRLFPGQIASYKAHVVRDGWSRDGVRVVYFHGKLKPTDLEPDDWVRREWEAE